jgi:cytochrome b
MDTTIGEPRTESVRAPLVPPLPTTRVLVWDLPTRLLHWLLALSFAGALAVSVSVRHRSGVFPLHMLLGVIAALAVVLRAVWGFVGSRYARFSSFALAPRALLRYLWSQATGKGESHVGHNPATSWVALAILVSVLGVAATGAMAAMGVRSMRSVHQLVAYGTALLVVLHVAGVALHALRRRDDLVLGMVDGKKAVPSRRGLRSAHPIVALVFLALIGGAAVELVHLYDAASRTLALPGIAQMRLGGGARKRSLHPLPPPRERD